MIPQLIQQRITKLTNLYTNITKIPNQYKQISVIGKPIRWLLADQNNQYVNAKKKRIIDIDITSCFPSLCMYLFKDVDDDFINSMNSISDKKEKNKFISINKTEYLKIFNIMSKMIIFGFVFDRRDSDSVSLLEFEKDGCLIFSDSLDYFQHIEYYLPDTPFLEFIFEHFKFHIKELEYYIRCNNTSLMWGNNELKIKGRYKHVPKKIKELYIDTFNGSFNFNIFNEIYSNRVYDIIKLNNLKEILNDYYICSNGKVLNLQGQYDNWKINNVDPMIYLNSFVNPIVLFTRI